jgi:nitroimidazol reductase NimA-like FMN-containing flavoprotein (pyridoxamine 5'-phosphate oxidase superfamily)
VQTEENTRRLVEALLRSQRFAVLSTNAETGPYASLIAFWAPDDLSQVVFATMRATRKFNYLVSHPRVALLFDNRSNREVDIREAMAVTATGTARELSDQGAVTAASEAYLAKHPHLAGFVASPGCVLVRVVVDTYYVVTHFQSVVELHMPRAGYAG